MQIITLLSDLSLLDTKIAVLKGGLYQSNTALQIVDIAHDPSLQDLWQAAYITSSASRFFPAGTIHIIINSARPRARYVALHYNQAWFVAPDNGILPFAFGEGLPTALLCFEAKDTLRNTELISALTLAILQIVTTGSPNNTQQVTLQSAPNIAPPRVSPTRIDCNVLMADNYGNLVLNIKKEMFDDLIGKKSFQLKLPGEKDLTIISTHYNEVPKGQFLCRFNKTGYLEIAINHGRAISKFQTGIHSQRNIHYQYISIMY